MTGLLREVQAADYLGFAEISEFRAAVKAGTIPAPSKRLPIGRRTVDAWSKAALDGWLENRSVDVSAAGSLNGAIKEMVKS